MRNEIVMCPGCDRETPLEFKDLGVRRMASPFVWRCPLCKQQFPLDLLRNNGMVTEPPWETNK